ncbi:hypothetical protein EV13_1926 [Prochlorococcus sp. MIT 0702]|nr:hypothetical protein EV13_1926 [Prochlorococcus sp. MIT 0702]
MSILCCRYQSASNSISGSEGAWSEVLSRVANERDKFFHSFRMPIEFNQISLASPRFWLA